MAPVNPGVQHTKPEPLLQGGKKRYALFPIPPNEQQLFDMYKRHLSTFWVAEEIEWGGLFEDFETLPHEVQTWIKQILAFFASSDVLVYDNILTNFVSEIDNTTASLFYAVQGNIETIHSEVYALLLDTLVQDKDEKANLFNAIETIPCIAKKADFCIRRMDRSQPFAERLFCFGLFEGVAFSSSFAGVYAVKNMFPGKCAALTFSNELISRDETLHADYAALLYRDFVTNKMADERAHELVRELLVIESEFCRQSVPSSMISIDPEQMIQYVEFCADICLQNFGHAPLYKHKQCPLEFMALISLQSKSNFFEKKESSYAKVTEQESFKIVDDF